MKIAVMGLGLAAALFLNLDRANANPYVQGLWTKGNPVYVSQGASFMPSSFQYEMAFTNIAFLYHPLSAGSIIPEKIQPFLPPESWACNVGGGYLASNGQGAVGVGCGFNLLDSVRAYASNLLTASNNGTLSAAGKAIAPGSGPLNLYVSRQENIHFNGKFVPRWFLGMSYGF